MLKSLLDDAVIAVRQSDANLLAKENHGDEEQSNGQVDQSRGHEHVRQAHVVEPRDGCQRDGDTDGVADEGDTNESLGDELKWEECMLASVCTRTGMRDSWVWHALERLTSR